MQRGRPAKAQATQGVAASEVCYTTAPSALGFVLLAATTRGLCSVQLGDSEASLEADLATLCPGASRFPADAMHQAPHDIPFTSWLEAIGRFLMGKAESLPLPVDVPATPFQERVWALLRCIPWGETRTYSDLAAELGKPGAVRAVASACARNQVALVIPCHRVLRTDGALGGFRWGLERKRQLLALEARTTQTGSPGLFPDL